MKKKLSISDVAQNLGISVTTVSFILNGKAKERRISDAMARRVLDYAKKVGFVLTPKRNTLAKSKTIALLIPDYTNVLYMAIANEIVKAAYTYGYHVVCCSVVDNNDSVRELIDQLCGQQIDGFIFVPRNGVEDNVQFLLNKKVPLVLVDRVMSGLETNYVISEGYKGVLEGTLSLFTDKKASKVGFVGTTSNHYQMKKRLEGYMAAIDQVGGDFSIKKINDLQKEDAVVSEIKDFIIDNKLDGLFFATHTLAVAGLQAIKRNNLDVRGLVSFDDNQIFELMDSPVSAVVQNITEIAKQAVSVLMSEIKGVNKSVVQITIPCEFVVR